MDLSNFVELEVGKPYPGDVPASSMPIVDMTDGGLIVNLFFANPTPKEIDAIQSGVAQFALTVRDDIIFLLMRFGFTPWMDAQYNVNLSRSLTALPTPKEREGYAAQVTLVDCNTHIVRVLRLVGLQHRFSVALHDAIERQRGSALMTAAENDEQVRRVYSRHDTRQLLGYAIARCRVG